MERGDWIGGKPSRTRRSVEGVAQAGWAFSEHELPGTARHDPLAYLQNARSTGSITSSRLRAPGARRLQDPPLVEHEYPPRAHSGQGGLKPILKGSLAFTRKIDEAAACMFAAAAELLAVRQDIPVQGHGCAAYRS